MANSAALRVNLNFQDKTHPFGFLMITVRMSVRQAYFGGCKPGDESHSPRCEAVSACLARRSRSSRSLPSRNDCAFSRSALACRMRRSSSGVVCVKRRRFIDALWWIWRERNRRSHRRLKPKVGTAIEPSSAGGAKRQVLFFAMGHGTKLSPVTGLSQVCTCAQMRCEAPKLSRRPLKAARSVHRR